MLKQIMKYIQLLMIVSSYQTGPFYCYENASLSFVILLALKSTLSDNNFF